MMCEEFTYGRSGCSSFSINCCKRSVLNAIWLKWNRISSLYLWFDNWLILCTVSEGRHPVEVFGIRQADVMRPYQLDGLH